MSADEGLLTEFKFGHDVFTFKRYGQGAVGVLRTLPPSYGPVDQFL